MGTEFLVALWPFGHDLDRRGGSVGRNHLPTDDLGISTPGTRPGKDLRRGVYREHGARLHVLRRPTVGLYRSLFGIWIARSWFVPGCTAELASTENRDE